MPVFRRTSALFQAHKKTCYTQSDVSCIGHLIVARFMFLSLSSLNTFDRECQILFEALSHRYAEPALPNRLRTSLAEDGSSEDFEFGKGPVGMWGVGGHDVEEVLFITVCPHIVSMHL